MIIDVRPVSKVWVRMAWRSPRRNGLPCGHVSPRACGGRCSAASFRFNLVRAPCLSLSWTSYRGRLSPKPAANDLRERDVPVPLDALHRTGDSRPGLESSLRCTADPSLA
jgi:hypothetical protein